MTAVRSNNLRLKNQRFTPSGFNDIGRKNYSFLQKLNSFLKLHNSWWHFLKTRKHKDDIRQFSGSQCNRCDGPHVFSGSQCNVMDHTCFISSILLFGNIFILNIFQFIFIFGRLSSLAPFVRTQYKPVLPDKPWISHPTLISTLRYRKTLNLDLYLFLSNCIILPTFLTIKVFNINVIKLMNRK